MVERLRFDGIQINEWEEDVRSIARCDLDAQVVIHLAGIIRDEKFKEDPTEGYAVNVVGTLAVLNYCQISGARCVLASTSAVYRPPQDLSPLREEAATDPSTPYGMSKLLAEELCRRHAEDLGVPTIALRLFNVFGPGQPSSFLVAYMVECLMLDRPIVLRTPNAVRDFVYIEDALDAFAKAAGFTLDGFNVFNIGSGKATRVIDVVRTAEKVYGKTPAIDTSNAPSGESSAIVADISKAKEVLDWAPHWQLKRGLEAMKTAGETGEQDKGGDISPSIRRA